MTAIRMTIWFFTVSTLFLGCGSEDFEAGEVAASLEEPLPPPTGDDLPVDREPGEGDNEPSEPPQSSACLSQLFFDQLQSHLIARNCQAANQSQLNQVNAGNAKKEDFLAQCYQATNGSCWCDQLIRPNPSSLNTFKCTYGADQVHQLIHPDEDTWDYAIETVKIVEELQQKDILTRIIYNWWRPEPYNKNVGGSPTRHPFGTAIDVRFETKSMQNQAFAELCRMRARGRIRAIGYYSSTAIHIGVGDHSANTWGKSCPQAQQITERRYREQSLRPDKWTSHPTHVEPVRLLGAAPP
jgi:hypothetical protein